MAAILNYDVFNLASLELHDFQFELQCLVLLVILVNIWDSVLWPTEKKGFSLDQHKSVCLKNTRDCFVGQDWYTP